MDPLTVDDKILIMENKTVAQACLVPSPVSTIEAMELCPWPSARPASHPGIHFLWTTLGYTQYTNMDSVGVHLYEMPISATPLSLHR